MRVVHPVIHPMVHPVVHPVVYPMVHPVVHPVFLILLIIINTINNAKYRQLTEYSAILKCHYIMVWNHWLAVEPWWAWHFPQPHGEFYYRGFPWTSVDSGLKQKNTTSKGFTVKPVSGSIFTSRQMASLIKSNLLLVLFFSWRHKTFTFLFRIVKWLANDRISVVLKTDWQFIVLSKDH